MSLAACAKKILCDPDVSQAQAVANTLAFLDEQARSQYSNDPTQILDLKEIVSEIMNPYLKKGITETVDKINENSITNN
jgi:hypothetical protein